MQRDELVSIIVLTHNSAKCLPNCIESIFKQNYSNFELIIVDNLSTDDTRKMLAELKIPHQKSVKTVLNSENLGYNKGNIVGIENSKGSFIALVNPDTILDDSWITNVMNTFKEDPKLVAVNGILQNDDKTIQSTGGIMDCYGAVKQRKEKSEKASNYFYCPGAAFVFRRSLLADIRFDPNLFLYYDDVDFAWQVRLRGHKIGFCGIANAIHLEGQSQPGLTISKFYHICKNRIYICMKNYSRSRIAHRFITILSLVFLDSIYYSIKFRSVRYFFAMLKALGWNISNFAKLNHERKIIQKNRIVSDNEIEKFMLPYSVEINQFRKKSK